MTHEQLRMNERARASSELEEWTLRLQQVPVYTKKTFVKHVRTCVHVART